jgi:hypothetical protein
VALTALDWEHIGRLIREATARDRGYASFFEWPDRDQKEVGVVLSLFESLLAKEGLHYSNLRARGQGNDPPDCEAAAADGRRIGIEVTALVDSQGIKNAKAGRGYYWATWDKAKLESYIVSRISAKDDAVNLKGAPYDQYWMVIHCDEPELSHDRVCALLCDWSGPVTRLLDEAFLLFSYDPGHRICPYIRLPVKRAT